MAFTTGKMELEQLLVNLYDYLPDIDLFIALSRKMQAYLDACQSISTLLDKCFPPSKDLPWNHFNGLQIRLRHDPYGHWCFYIAVPRHHVLFGVHYDDLGSDATYSNFMAGDKLWWEFGWDYNSCCWFIPAQLLFDIKQGYPDAFMNAEVLTPEYLESEIQKALKMLLSIHKTKTGVDFEAIPGSSWSNARHRKIKAARSAKAEANCRFF